MKMNGKPIKLIEYDDNERETYSEFTWLYIICLSLFANLKIPIHIKRNKRTFVLMD